MRDGRRIAVIISLLVILSGCMMPQQTKAPVFDISMIDAIPKNGIHRVHRGDTLYTVAWRYGLDYRLLAERNHITSPYRVYVGQVIYLKPDHSHHNHRIAVSSRPQRSPQGWVRPASGPIIGYFSGKNKGIDIGGRLNDPVWATLAGRVVYSGNGLRGYGNLIIIKHNARYLSAYAHNNLIFVKEGQWVKAGQRIAKMGDSDAQRVMLHFEIRQGGKPVNPLVYLRR